MSKAVEQEPKCLGQLKRECSGCSWYPKCLEKSAGLDVRRG